jgi:heat shock protein beta
MQEVADQEVAEAPETDGPSESYEFEAEVSKVMDIIINSLYSDKDIFLRELVSNASDACDKRRFLGGFDQEYQGRIRITGDKEGNVLTIEDNGVGMSRKELRENLGRIAQSGTKAFSEALGANSDDAKNLIGQFGVGFYSAFLVAERVQVVTKATDGPQLRWESEAANKYTITEDNTAPIEGSGTRLILHLKEEADKYVDDYRLRDMLKKYSEFISFPIELWAEKTEYDTVPDPDAEVKEGEEPKTKTVPRTSKVWEVVNSAKPLWMRDPKEISDQEYEEFYKTTFKAYDIPAAFSHFSLEGQIEFRAMLFCPTQVPWELSKDMFAESNKPMKLYVKRVFISDEFQDKLLPRWASFLKGMVDSEDLPLNVSRELVQRSKVISIIAKRLVRKALDMIGSLQKGEKLKWESFQANFGRYLKVGLIEDKENKDRLLELAAFSSSKVEKVTTLPEYVERMPAEQKQIYYLASTSRSMAESSPALESLRKQGFEVIYALDQIDEVSLQGVGKFRDFDVIDATKENAEIGEQSEEEKKASETAKDMYKDTTEFLKKILGNRVDKVQVSNRLEESPAAIVQPQWGMSPQMQKYMRAQAAAAGEKDMVGPTDGSLEINPSHPVVQRLKDMVEEDADSPLAKGFAELLYDVAAVSSGYDLKDAPGFARRVVALMSNGESALSELAMMMAGADTVKQPPAAETSADDDKGEEAEAEPAEAPTEEADGEPEAIVPEVL